MVTDNHGRRIVVRRLGQPVVKPVEPKAPPEWTEAELELPETKQAISLRVDRDVLEFFKSQGKGYQTRMNAVLRAYMAAQKR